MIVAFGVVGSLVKVPYVALGPGPSYDTLGTDDNHAQVISITGTTTYPTDGQLRMTTVNLTQDLTMFGALGLWLSGDHALAPREEYYQPGQSDDQVTQQNAEEMTSSQSNAQVAALRQLGYPISVLANTISKNSPAESVIKAGDKLITVNGTTIGGKVENVYSALKDTKPGQTVSVTVQTGTAAARTLSVVLGKNPNGTSTNGFLGVGPVENADVNFKVNIALSGVGGPSAGLMFTLGIIDKLTKGGINGGLAVAGTGEIDYNGTVGPIGGIPFKLIGARDAGAQYFLVPAANCAEAKAKIPSGLTLLKVNTLQDALTQLANLKSGKATTGC